MDPRPQHLPRHDPDNVLAYRAPSASAETAEHQGPLHRPSPRDTRLFPDEGDPQDPQDQEPPRRSNYYALVETATSGRRGSNFEAPYSTAPDLDTYSNMLDPGTVPQQALRGTDPASQPKRATLAQGSQLSLLARNFIGLGLGKYAESADFITLYPGIVVKSEINALTAEALIAEKSGQPTRAQTCIHQALLLRECEKAGPKNFDSFFRQLTARDGRAKDVFVRDVKKVYLNIKEQAGATQPQTKGAASEPQARKPSVISYAARDANLPNASMYAQRPTATTQSQAPVARDPEGRLFYTDNRGNLLRPASSRHDTDRYRAASYTVGMPEQREMALRPSPVSERRQNIPKRSTRPLQPAPTATPRNVCGSAIILKDVKDLSIVSKAATIASIGGCLCIDSLYYGFTTAHVMSPNSRTYPDRPTARTGPSSKTWEGDADLSELSDSDDERVASSAEGATMTPISPLTNFAWKPQNGSTPWQRVSATSVIQDQPHDLILIPLDSSLGPFENAVELDQSAIFGRTVYPKEVPEDQPADVDCVTLVAGKSGHQRVRPSPTMGGLFLPSAGRVISVWSVRHEPRALAPGDSGSWAIGDEGELYGYLVGACEMLGVSYIAPMATAMAAIRAMYKINTVSIPGRSAQRKPALSERDKNKHERPTSLRRTESESSSLSEQSVTEPDVRGGRGEMEDLDNRYQERSDARTFFVLRRVFAMLWHESGEDLKGEDLSDEEVLHPTLARKFGGAVYSHIRRMVVVKERHGYCWCMPIHTYNNRGVLKPWFSDEDRQAHAIVYMDNTRPMSTDSEIKRGALVKKPIAVHAASPDQKLHPLSRLNFARRYSVEWNVKVMHVGRVASESMSAFQSYAWASE